MADAKAIANLQALSISPSLAQTPPSEAALQESEECFRLIVDAIPGFVCTLSATGEVELLNRQVLEYFGKTVEELKNWSTNEAVHPDDLPRVIDAWRHSVETGQPYALEFRQRRADGAYRWFQSRALPARDTAGRIAKWYMLLTDIDDRKRAEQKLRQEEQELRQIVDTIAQLVVLLSPDGDALYGNRFTLEYTGLSLEDLKANNFRARVFHPDDVERVREERRKALLRGIPFENEQRARRHDGQYRWFYIRYNPLRDEQGRAIRWYAAGIDIEDRKQAEDRTRQENFALREQIAGLENCPLQRSKSRSHRLHGPDYRRNRHREGTDCARGTQAFAACQPAFYHRELRFDSRFAYRLRIVRP
jgi:PAS domain S-box-containing protein